MLHSSLEPTVDRDIIGREFQSRFLYRAEEGNIRGPDFGFDEKGFVVRDNIDDWFAGLNDTSNGVHIELVHTSCDGRANLSSTDAIFTLLENFYEFLEFAFRRMRILSSVV